MITGKELIKFINENNFENESLNKILTSYREQHGKTQSKNEIIKYKTYAIIKVNDEQTNETYDVKIDLEDIEKVSKYTWRIMNKYPKARINKRKVPMHRYILNYVGTLDIDHINHNKLDNRKANLRIVHRVENLANNTSDNIYKRYNKYYAIFTRYGEKYNLGSFTTYEDARKAVMLKQAEIDKNKNTLLTKFLLSN